jgi:2-keto-3-deoxy-L-rhamnonate aldolase RhmA
MLDIVRWAHYPFLETVGDVRKLVEYGKYYPLGRRGFAMGRSAGFGLRRLRHKDKDVF